MNKCAITSNSELYHYGVKGMKWGVRRYQNSDGTLTAAGKKKARYEYRSDNKTAYELGKNATIFGRAAAKSTRRSIKLENKLNKQLEQDPEVSSRRTKSILNKYDASMETTAQLGQQYMDARVKAEKHCKSLIDKYGEEAVSDIKYKDIKLPKAQDSPGSVKVMNERTNNTLDYAAAVGASFTSFAVGGLMGSPVAVIFGPKTTGEKARNLELTSYYTNLKKKNNKTNKNDQVQSDPEYDSKVADIISKHDRKITKAKKDGTYTEAMEFDMWDEIDQLNRD